MHGPDALARPPDRGIAYFRRASPSQRAGAALLALVLVAASVRVVPAFRWVDRELASTSGLTRLQREVASARAVDIDPRPIERAGQIIPEDGIIAVLVGENYPFTHDISAFKAPTWAMYRLLPRRYVTDAASAEWVISYDADLAAHLVVAKQTYDLGLGVTLVRQR